MDKGAGLAVVPQCYVSPSQRERAIRALGELKNALTALRRGGWAQTRDGWGLARSRKPGAAVVPLTSLNLEQLDAGELELVGWTITGALRAHGVDQLGRHYAEKYLAKVLPAEVSAWSNHPFTDEHDALRALQKAIRLASADAGVTELTERPARGAAASPSPPRRVRSAGR